MVDGGAAFRSSIASAFRAIGGILGVMYSVPLRRALVAQSDLPYPEGVAAAEVLKVGTVAPAAASQNRAGLLALVAGTLLSAAFAAIVATRIFAAQLAAYFRLGSAATGFGFSLSLALLGAGQLIGLSVGFGDLDRAADRVGDRNPRSYRASPGGRRGGRRRNNRVVASSAVHRRRGDRRRRARSLGRLARPVATGVSSALAASRRRRSGGAAQEPRTEQDLPISVVGIVSLACLIPLAALLAHFLGAGRLAPLEGVLSFAAVVYVVIAGFFVAAACGYMAGLIGSSNSPVSGLAILAVIGASLMLVAIAAGARVVAPAELVAYALFVTAVVLCVATISNDNLQDLKTGQLVDATPWRQQVALVAGVVIGAAVIPPNSTCSIAVMGLPARRIFTQLRRRFPRPKRR